MENSGDLNRGEKRIKENMQNTSLKGSGGVDFEWKASGIYIPLPLDEKYSVASSA